MWFQHPEAARQHMKGDQFMIKTKVRDTDSRRELLKRVRSETQQEGALSNSRVPNQEQLEQVVELRLTRRSIHTWNSNPANQTK